MSFCISSRELFVLSKLPYPVEAFDMQKPRSADRAKACRAQLARKLSLSLYLSLAYGRLANAAHQAMPLSQAMPKYQSFDLMNYSINIMQSLYDFAEPKRTRPNSRPKSTSCSRKSNPTTRRKSSRRSTSRNWRSRSPS